MRELLSIADRIEELSREIPVSSFSGFLEETNRKIKKIASNNSFYVDVYKSKNSSAECKSLFQKLQEQSDNSEFVLLLKDESNYKLKIFEDLFPSISIIFVDAGMVESESLKQHFKYSDDQYKVTFLVNLLADPNDFKSFGRLFSFRTKAISLSPSDLEGKSAAELIRQHLEVQAIDKLKRYSYLHSVKPVFSFLNDILIAENKAANTRKILNTGNTNITRKEEQTINNSELATNLRQVIQKSTQELEKSYKFKYEDLNKPNTGKFSIISAERTNKLTDFNKRALAEKSEKVETSIDPAFMDEFTSAISSTIKGELGKDEAFIKSSFEDLITQINTQLKAKNIQPLNANNIYPPFPDKDRTVQSFCYINKHYVGEVIKRGAMEYFVALRDYTGLIMVVGGLLAPLSMFASGWDGSLFKSMADWVKRAVAGISILMVIYGIYDLRKRIPLKREEEFQRELAKAKETLLQESKRMFSDSSRDWVSNISNWIKDTTQNINNQIDRNIKDLQAQRVALMNQEKQQQQKQLQSIDLLIRSIQSADRVKDQITTRYRDWVSEIEKDLKF